MTDADRRLSQKLNAALHSPDFAVRWLSQASGAERAEVLRRWATQSPPASAAPGVARPGLRKCGAQPGTSQSEALAAQLAAFARSIGRVG